MEFGWINLAGGIVVALMLLPNILYALRNPGQENLCTSRIANILEQLGRYGSMALMVLPLGVWKFGFSGVLGLLVWLVGNGLLLTVYWVLWRFYLHRKSRKIALWLAIVPSCIFLLSGATLRHWLLVATGMIFSAAHIYVTMENHK